MRFWEATDVMRVVNTSRSQPTYFVKQQSNWVKTRIKRFTIWDRKPFSLLVPPLNIIIIISITIQLTLGYVFLNIYALSQLAQFFFSIIHRFVCFSSLDIKLSHDSHSNKGNNVIEASGMVGRTREVGNQIGKLL